MSPLLFTALLAAAPDPAALEYDAARRLRRQGEPAAAARRFEALAARYPHSPLAPRALAAAGAIYHWQLDQPARAVELYEAVLAGPADRLGVAPALFQRLDLLREVEGPRAELHYLQAYAARHPTSPLVPGLLIRAARILDEDLGQLEAALAPLVTVRERYPQSSRWDEALMREASLLRTLGRPAEALARYRALLATERTSFIVGDYNSALLDDAYFEAAETLARFLGRAAEAEALYRRLADGHPTSRLADDALLAASDLARARGDLAQAQLDLARREALR